MIKIKGLVFGNGFLGKRISEYFNYPISSLRIMEEGYIANSLKEILDSYKPKIIINAIGKTGRPNIDWCETHKEETERANVNAVQELAFICAQKSIKLIHLSSGCIYEGYKNGEGYSEEDEPNFSGSFYSDTKMRAEEVIKNIRNTYLMLKHKTLDYLIIRIRMPIDNMPDERNYITKISKYKQVINTPNSMTVVTDMLYALEKLIEQREIGIFNVVNPGLCSAAEIMAAYKEIIDPKHEFEVITAEGLDKMTISRRSNCALSTKKLESKGIYLPEIHEAIKKCLEVYKHNLKLK